MTAVTVTVKHTRNNNDFHSIDPRIEVQNAFLCGSGHGIIAHSVVANRIGFSSYATDVAFSPSGHSFHEHSLFDDRDSDPVEPYSHFGHSSHNPFRRMSHNPSPLAGSINHRMMGHNPFPLADSRNHAPKISQFCVQCNVDSSVSVEKFKNYLAGAVRFSSNIHVMKITGIDQVACEYQRYKKCEQEEILAVRFSSMRVSSFSDLDPDPDDDDSIIGCAP